MAQPDPTPSAGPEVADLVIEDMYERNVASLNAGKGVFAHLAHAPTGTYELQSPFDQVTRVFGYRTVGSLPLIVTVGKSLEEVMLPLEG